MKSTTDGAPGLLVDGSERVLTAVLRAIVAQHPDELQRTDDSRVAQALALLLGRRPSPGSPQRDRDELLEFLAFDFSVATKWEKKDVSPTEIAEKLVSHHPSTAHLKERGAIVRDLVRKFRKHEPELLARHSFDGTEGPGVFLNPLRKTLAALAESGLRVGPLASPLDVQGENDPT